MLALVMTLIWQNIIALIIGMAIYAFGLGICNATLYRSRYFPASMEKVQYRQ
jgi:DHA1 family multidrug/chloramphenicol efflux transport protein-like MFS transporter